MKPFLALGAALFLVMLLWINGDLLAEFGWMSGLALLLAVAILALGWLYLSTKKHLPF